MLDSYYSFARLPMAACRILKARSSLLIVPAACLVLLLGAAALTLNLNRPTGQGPPRQLKIRTGMSTGAIGRLLKAQGVVRSATLFGLLVRVQNLDQQLEAGTYELDGTLPTTAVIRELLQAPVRTHPITIPEGLTRQAIAGVLARAGMADSSRFMDLTGDPGFIRSLGLQLPNLEGFLFPETYFLNEGATEEQIIRRMVNEFRQVFRDSMHARLEVVDLTLREAVTLASIVEREAVVPQEQPTIAGVFLRRLQLGRRLESCATVEYALGVHKERLTNGDLRVDSPYNTYRYRGLPPGPIGNPGRAALLAVLYPVDTDYLYFVARGDGTHIFSRTHTDHQRAKKLIR